MKVDYAFQVHYMWDVRLTFFTVNLNLFPVQTL